MSLKPSLKRPWKTFRKYLPYRPDILIERAKQIYKKSQGKPILLFMSGGIDSEFVGHFLIEANVPFTPLIVRYENGFNDYDINWARHWCVRRSLLYLEVSTHVEILLDSAVYKKILNQIQIARPFNPSLFPALDAAFSSGFSCITGCGEASISIESKGLYEHLTPQGDGLLKWARSNGHQNDYHEFLRGRGVKALFIESAKVAFEKTSRSWQCEELKSLIYQNHFEYVPRPKFNGFEFLVIQRPGVVRGLCPPGFSYVEKVKRIKY